MSSLMEQAKVVAQKNYIRLPAPEIFERNYQEVHQEARELHLLRACLIGILSCASYLFADYCVLDKYFSEAAFLRLGIFTPVSLIALLCFYYFRDALRPYQEQAITLGVFSLSMMVLYIEYLSTLEGKQFYTTSTLLVIAYACIIIHSRFICSVLHCSLTFIASVYVFIYWMKLPTDQVQVLIIDHLDIIALSLLANYVIHLQLRKNYAQHLLLEHEKNQLLTTKGQLLELTEQDPLTGIGNRRYFETHTQAIMEQTCHSGVAILYIDIDFFKAYNDHFGHKAGDHALTAVAQCIKQSLRQEDICARYGGEEFLVMLPNTSQRQTLSIAERIRQSLERGALPHSASPLGIVTLSIGAYYQRRPSFEDNELTRMIDAADKALYFAKNNGKNQVRLVSDE